jgi:hypothetical protein
MDFRAHDDFAASGSIRRDERIILMFQRINMTINQSTGGEVGTFDELHQIAHADVI